MKKFLVILILAASVGGLYFYRGRFLNLPQIKQLQSEIKEIEKQISAPEPLRSTEDSPIANLTRDGVIKFTNEARAENPPAGGSLPALKMNAKLNTAAARKLQDMFAKQYFAHEGPDGKGPADWVSGAGYDYIAIGENLALGNFKDDADLVAAWMNSPGHRANILNKNFQEIGAAVGRGVFEGKITWLAVQEFGKPKSACPAVDVKLKSTINANQAVLREMQSQIETLRAEIENTHPPRGEEYNAKVQQYNDLVSQYNSLAETEKSLIDEYNAQVNAFNACLAQ